MGARRLLAAALIAAGPLASSQTAPALADPAGVCGEAGGAWREHGQYPRQTDEPRCEFQENLSQDRAIAFSSPVPDDMLGDAWLQSQLAAFIKGRVAALRAGAPSAPQSLAAGDIDRHEVVQHSASVQSFVFHELINNTPSAHPNDEYLTMTIDLAEHQQLKIADLFKAGTNIQSAITPLVLRYAPKGGGLDQLSIGGANDAAYTAFALAPAELVVYLPSSRKGAVAAGAFTTHIPLSAFGDTLRPEYR